MAVSMDVIKRVIVQGSSEGLDKLEGELRKLISTTDGVSVSFEKASRSQLSAEAAYKRLSASIDPAYKGQQQIEKGTNTLNRAFQQGAIDQSEYTKRLNQLKSKYAEVASANDNVVNGSKLQRYELVNLGRQIQDIGVSLQAGQSPFTVIVQQGSQVFDVFTSTKATFKGMAAQFLAMVTPVSVLTTAFVGMTAAGVVAALQWGSAQKAIQLALAGAGRASGATSGGINALGAAPGFSISETRAFATELVKTGKIGADAIAGIVEVGHDVATVLGTDAAEAAKILAKTFSDPISGSKELNQSLGFLDAATLRQITNLTEQNKLGEAHAVILEKIKESTKGVTEAVGTSTKFWEALGNTISDWWNNFGAWASRATGIGFVQGLDEQIESTKKKIEELKRESASFQSLPEIGYVAGSTSSIEQLSAEEDKLKKLEEAWKRYQERIKKAQEERDSLALSSAIESASPEIAELDKLNNKYILLQDALNKVVETGGEASPVLKALGKTFQQLVEAVERAGNSVINYKTQSQQAIEALQAQISSIGKRSPEALGQQAYEETIRRLGNTDEALAQARLSRTLAQKQAEQGIIDSRNQQNLSAQQSVEKAQLELSLIGQTVGAQETARAKLQAKQQLEQEALRIYGDRNAYDRDHLAELEKQAEIEGKIKDITAKTQLNKDIAFEKSTVFLSSIDQQIAQRLRPTQGDNVEVTLKSTEAAELRQIEVMKQMKDAATSFVEAFVSGLAKGQSLTESLKAALQGLGSQLINMGSQNLVGNLFKATADNGQQAGGLLGGGLTSLLGLGSALAPGVGSIVALGVGTALTFFSQSKQKADQAAQAAAQAAQQLAEAQKQWASMAGQVSSWMAEWTTGFAGELGKAIESARSQMQQFANAASAAHDSAGVAAVQQAFNVGVTRSIQEAITALQHYGIEQSDVAKKIEDVNNKSTDLKNVLIEWGVAAADAAQIVDTKLNAALERLRNNFLADIVRKINDLAGGTWINQLNDLVTEIAQLRQDAAALGIQTTQIDTYYVLAAQKVIDSNKLTGDAFNTVAQTLGPLGGQLHEFNAALEETAQVVKRTAEQIRQTIQSYQDQLFIAQQDQQTLAGALAVFNLQAQRAREEEVAQGGEALVALEALQAQQRLNIVAEFNQRALEEQQRADEERLRQQQQAAEEQQRIWDEASKFLQNALQNIQGWISSFLAGAQSPLSPAGRLASAQSTFSTQYAAAIGGNRDALSGITGNAQSLVEAIRAMYGSGPTGQTLINQLLSQLNALPAQVSPEQFIVNQLNPSIQSTTTAVATNTSAIQSMQAALQSALSTSNPSAIASALSSYFSQLDTNVNGLLDYNELVSGLGGMANNSQLATMFKTLDTDNSGSLSRLELINTTASGTTSATNTVNSSIGGVKSDTTAMNTSLLALAQVSNNTGTTSTNTANSYSALLNIANTLNTISGQIGNTGVSTSLVGEVERVRSNLVVQNANWGSGWATSPATYAAGQAIAQYGSGGYVDGPSHFYGGRNINVEGGEYVINRIQTARFRPQLEAINAGRIANDNGEMRQLIARVASLEQAVVRAVAASGTLVAGHVAALNDTQAELNKRMKRAS